MNYQVSLVALLGIFGLGTQPQLLFSKEPSVRLWDWTSTSNSWVYFCFGGPGGPQPTLRISWNIWLRWVSTSTWKFSKYFASLGLNLNLGILEIFCFAGISTSISKHLNYLRYKFWNHWVFLLLFKKSDISTLMLFLYGYVCPVIYMALNAKMFLWWFYAPKFSMIIKAYTQLPTLGLVWIFLSWASCPIICPAKMPWAFLCSFKPST